jgi:hypothetical protein
VIIKRQVSTSFRWVAEPQRACGESHNTPDLHEMISRRGYAGKLPRRQPLRRSILELPDLVLTPLSAADRLMTRSK